MITTVGQGFADPVLSAQSAFRAIMDATAKPGTVRVIECTASAPAPLSPAAAAIALTLLDQDTAVWLDPGLADVQDVTDWLRFHTGARIVREASRSAFALVGNPRQVPPFDSFNLGTLEYPDCSTTLILQVESFADGVPLALAGPGIRGRRDFRATALPNDIAERLAANRALFPRGVDLLLVSGNEVAALPRSVRAANKGG